MPAESLKDAIELYAQIVQNPHLPEDQLEDARMMSLQEIRANQDEPTHRVMQTLRQMHYGPVLGRPSNGTEEGIKRITQSDVREFLNLIILRVNPSWQSRAMWTQLSPTNG